MLFRDQFLQMGNVLINSHARVLNQPAVPSTMQIAWMPTALSRTEFCNCNPISASRLPNCMERLMHVTDEVDEELQCFDAVIPWSSPIPENLFEYFYAIHHAIVMVGCRALVPAVGQKTVAVVGKAGGILGDIDKVPIVRLVPLGPNLVRPVRDGCEAPIPDQRTNPSFRILGQAGLSQRPHDLVPFRPPADKGRGHELRIIAVAMNMARFTPIPPPDLI